MASGSIREPNDAFIVTYPSTPSDVCARLATAVANATYDIRVNGTSVFTSGQVDPTAVAQQCSSSSAPQMEFVFHSGLITGTAVAAPPLVLPPTPPSVLPPTSPPVGSPVGPVGPVGPATPVGPVDPGPSTPAPSPPPVTPPVGPPVIPTPPTATPPPSSVTPPTSPVPACAVPPNTVENQRLDCSAGQYGSIWQSRYATWSCPEAWDRPVQNGFSGWSTTSNTCTPCPAPVVQTQTQWVASSGACPSGQVGTRTWEREQVATQTVNYLCPAGTQTLPGPTPSGWSTWVDTGAVRNVGGTCAPASCPGGGNPKWQFTCGGGCDTSPAYAPWLPLINAAKASMPPGAPWPSPTSMTYATTYDNQPPRSGAADYSTNNGACSLDNLGENSARVQRYIDSSGRVTWNSRLDTCACPAPPPPPNPVRLAASPQCVRSYTYAPGQDPAARRLISNLTVSTDAGWSVVGWNTGGRCSLNGNTCTVDTVCASGNSAWTISVTGRNAATGQEFTATQDCECISRGL